MPPETRQVRPGRSAPGRPLPGRAGPGAHHRQRRQRRRRHHHLLRGRRAATATPALDPHPHHPSLLIVVQEMNARMGIVTGKGLADLIRENFGVKVTFSDVRRPARRRHRQHRRRVRRRRRQPADLRRAASTSPCRCGAVSVWVLVLKGTYKIGREDLPGRLRLLPVPTSSPPSWPSRTGARWPRPRRARRCTSTPPTSACSSAWSARPSRPGCSSTMQSAVVEKGIKSRTTATPGSTSSSAASSPTWWPSSSSWPAPPRSAQARRHASRRPRDAAVALAPLAGQYASWLFAFGLLQRLALLRHHPAARHRLLRLRGFGWESGVDKKYGEARQFYWLYTAHPGRWASRSSAARAAAHPHHAGLAGRQRHPAAVSCSSCSHQQREAHGRVHQRPLLQRSRLGHHGHHDRADHLPGGHGVRDLATT